MSKDDLRAIADGANIIINGYAFTKDESGFVRILNLNNVSSAAVLNANGRMIETSMDDIELGIVSDYYALNEKYLEA